MVQCGTEKYRVHRALQPNAVLSLTYDTGSNGLQNFWIPECLNVAAMKRDVFTGGGCEGGLDHTYDA